MAKSKVQVPAATLTAPVLIKPVSQATGVPRLQVLSKKKHTAPVPTVVVLSALLQAVQNSKFSGMTGLSVGTGTIG